MPPKPRNPRFTMADMLAYHKAVNEIWEKSEQYRESVGFFEETIIPLRTFKTDQALCIAIGSFESAYDDARDDYGNESVGRRAFFQLVAFETWIRLLRSRQKSQFEKGIYFQDPAFTVLDIKFLQDRGYKVVSNGPENFSPILNTIQEMMTPHTFAFIPCGRWFTHLLYQCLEVSHPALLISTPIPPQRPEIQYIGTPKEEAANEIERRRISRPFFSSRLFCTMFEFTNHPDSYWWFYNKLGANKKLKKLDEGLQWTSNPWIYWTPDNKSRLTTFGMDDDMMEFNPLWVNRIEKRWPKELRKAPSMISNSSDSEDAELDQPVPEPTVKETDYAAMAAASLETHYLICTASWATGSVCKEIDKFFKETILPLKTMKIDCAIGLALGTFGYSDGFDESIGDSIMTQFVAFEHWIELLRSAGNDILPQNIIFQNPAMTVYDKAFITSRGYTFTGQVLTESYGTQNDEKFFSPQQETAAQKKTTSSTFLFTPCGTSTTIIRQCLEVAHPALIISSPLDGVRHAKVHIRNKDGLKNDDGTDAMDILETGNLEELKENAYLSENNALGLRDALAEREITRPFYSTRLFRPLLLFSDYPDGPDGRHEEGLAQKKIKNLLNADYFVQDLWVYWRPDNEGLVRYGIEDDMRCTCTECLAGGKVEGWWRIPDPFYEELEDGEEGGEDEGVEAQQGEVWEPSSDTELSDIELSDDAVSDDEPVGEEDEEGEQQELTLEGEGTGPWEEESEAQVDEPAEAAPQPSPFTTPRGPFPGATLYYFF